MTFSSDVLTRFQSIKWGKPIWAFITASTSDTSSPNPPNFAKADIAGNGISRNLFTEYDPAPAGPPITFGIKRNPNTTIDPPPIVNPPTPEMESYYRAWFMRWGGINGSIPGGGTVPPGDPIHGTGIMFLDLSTFQGNPITFSVTATITNPSGSGEVGVSASVADWSSSSGGGTLDEPGRTFTIVFNKATKTVSVLGGHPGGGGGGG